MFCFLCLVTAVLCCRTPFPPPLISATYRVAVFYSVSLFSPVIPGFLPHSRVSLRIYTRSRSFTYTYRSYRQLFETIRQFPWPSGSDKVEHQLQKAMAITDQLLPPYANGLPHRASPPLCPPTLPLRLVFSHILYTHGHARTCFLYHAARPHERQPFRSVNSSQISGCPKPQGKYCK